MRRILLTTSFLLLPLIVAALSTSCGGSKGSNQAHSSAAVRSTYQSFWQAYMKPDPEKTCSLLTTRGRRIFLAKIQSSGMGFENGAPKTCSDGVKAVHKLLTTLSISPRLTIRKVSVNGDRATISWSTRSSASRGTGTTRLVYQGGRWLIDEDGTG